MSERLQPSNSSIPQIVSNMRMYLNFDQSDATGIINRLSQGISKQHLYPMIKPSEDKTMVNRVLPEKVSKDLDAYYSSLHSQGNPDLFAAFCFLGKLLTTHKSVLRYLEARSSILQQRMGKGKPPKRGYMNSKSIINPALQSPDLSRPTQEEYHRSVSQPRTTAAGVLPHHPAHHPTHPPIHHTPRDSPSPSESRREPHRHSPQDTLEPPTRSRAHAMHRRGDDSLKRLSPAPELFPSKPFLTNNYLVLQMETQINPPPSMRETDLFAQEQLVVEEIISLLMGIQGWYISFDPESRKLGYYKGCEYINPSLKSLIRKIEPLFCFYCTVTQFIEEYSSYEKGLVSQSLCSVMSTLLKEHYTVAAQLETQLRAGKLSLQQLWFYLQPCMKTLGLLNDVCDEVENGHLHGAAIMTLLHKKISTFIGDPKARQWCLSLATHTCVPYFDILENWIYRGIILDPREEFMIEESKTVPNPALKSHPYYDLTTNYWDRTYTRKQEKTPVFFENLHEKILKTGKYLNVFRESEKKMINPNNVRIKYSENPRDYIEPISLAFEFASQKLLEELSADHDLMGKLTALRRYFLMIQGDFFLYFMVVARTELFGKAEDIQVNRLQSLLESALRNSNAKYDKYSDNLKVLLEKDDVVHMLAIVLRIDKQLMDKRLTTSDAFDPALKFGEAPTEMGLSGLEAFNLEFEVKWPVSLVISHKVMLYYQLLFRQLFYFKHVETSLNEAWVKQKNIKKYQIIGQAPAYSRALVLRQQMISYVQNFQFYMMYEVIQPNWKQFQYNYNRAGTVDDVMQSHMDFLEKCVKDFLMHHHEIISIIWKILALCIQFTNYLNSIAAEFNKKLHGFSHSNQVKQAYQDAAAKNVHGTVVEEEFERFIKMQHRRFSALLDKFIDKVSRLTHETDPDHKTNSLIIRLKYYTRINPSNIINDS